MSIVPAGPPSVTLGSCLCNQPHELQIFMDSEKYNVGVTFTFFLCMSWWLITAYMNFQKKINVVRRGGSGTF